MTIEYKDSKRIVALSTDKVETPTMSNDVYGSVSGWTTHVDSDITLDTTNKGVTYTSVTENAGIGRALTVSDTKWLCQFEFNMSAWTTNDAGVLSITSDYTVGFKDTGIKTITFMPQGASYWRFVLLSGQTNSYAENTSSNNQFALNTTYYVDMIRDGTVVRAKVWTNAERSGTPHVTIADLTIGTNCDGMDGIQHWSETAGDAGSGWVRNVNFYDGVTSLTSKPTNVQDNSILVEKDTGKRYWFSEALAPTFEDDFDNSDNWDSSGSTISITGNKVVGNTVTGSTDRIYWDATHVTLSDTKWIATFNYKVSVVGVDSDHSPLVFSAGTAQIRTSSQDYLGFDVYGQSASPTRNVRLNYRDGTSNGYSSNKITPTLDRQYYCTMSRDGATLTLSLFTDEARTTHETGSPISITNVPSTVTGLTHAQITAWNGSASNSSWEVDTLKIYNGVTSITPATWTFPPTLEDDFSSSAGWTQVTNTASGVSGGELIGLTNSSGTNGAGAWKDYGLVSDTKFVLRCKFQIVTQSGGSGNASTLYFGISDTNGATSPHSNRDGFGIAITNYAASGMLWLYPDGTTWDNADTDLSLTPTETDYYLEIARTSATSVTFKLFSDEYSTVVKTHTQTIASTLNGLRYIMFQEWRNGSGNTTKVAVDDLQIFNGVGSV